MKIRLAIISIFIIFSIPVAAQQNRGLLSSTDSIYHFGSYIIYPYQKRIAVMTPTSGTTKDGGEWDGFTWKDISINYDSAILIIAGDDLGFKNDYFFDGFDLATLQVIGKRYNSFLYQDKNGIHFGGKTFDLHGYTSINAFIYRDSIGNYYFFHDDLEKITGLEKLDIPSFQHVMGYYFSDKDGLYYFHPRYDPQTQTSILAPQKIVAAEEGTMEPEIHEHYFIYGDSVFSYKSQRLELNARNIKEIKYDPTESVITDGNNFYDMGSCYCWYGLNNSYRKFTAFFRSSTQFDIPEWYRLPAVQYPGNDAFYIGPQDPARKDKKINKQGFFIETKEGYGFLTYIGQPAVPEKVSKLFFYDAISKEERRFRPHAFKYIDDALYVYSKQLYCYDYPVWETVNVPSLKRLVVDGINTDYITDGKIMIHINSLMSCGNIIRNGVEYKSLKNAIIRNVNFDKLKIISPDVLVDDKRLYRKGLATPINIRD